MKGDLEEQMGASWIILAFLILGGGFAFNVLNAPNNPTGVPSEDYTALFMLVGGGILVAKVLGDSMKYERYLMAGGKPHQYGIGALVFGAVALFIVWTLSKGG